MYKILEDFKGSQDGRFVTEFKAGEIVNLSDDLASVVVADGRAEKLEPESIEAPKKRGRKAK
jgi:hypothetical protein